MSNTQEFSRRRFFGQAAVAGATGLLARLSLGNSEPAMPYFQDRGWLVGCWTRPLRGKK